MYLLLHCKYIYIYTLEKSTIKAPLFIHALRVKLITYPYVEKKGSITKAKWDRNGNGCTTTSSLCIGESTYQHTKCSV